MTNDWGYAQEDPNYWTFNYVDISQPIPETAAVRSGIRRHGPYVVGVAQRRLGLPTFIIRMTNSWAGLQSRRHLVRA